MNKNNFVEWATPKIVGASTEGGTEVFPVKWFDKDAFLSMSPQLHKQFIAGNTGTKYYEMTPYFRAEKHRTKRHLSELWGIDIEVPFIDYTDILKIIEQLIMHIFESVKERNKADLEILGRELPEIKLPFRRVTYTEALEILAELREESIKTAKEDKDILPELTWGEDIPDPSELALWNHINEPFFIVEYPSEVTKFYVMKVPENPKIAQAYDFIFIRELASGATREHRYDVLIEQIKEKGLIPEHFTSYLDAFRYGVAPHAGMGLGVERLLMAITGIDDVMEVVPFPRTIDRLAP
jgi:aspartyl-tRNA synthetase